MMMVMVLMVVVMMVVIMDDIDVFKEFNPELCGALASLFSRVYCSTGSPIDVMKGYLSVITRGACSLSVAGAEQTFNCADYDRRAALLGTPLKGMFLRDVPPTQHHDPTAIRCEQNALVDVTHVVFNRCDGYARNGGCVDLDCIDDPNRKVFVKMLFGLS